MLLLRFRTSIIVNLGKRLRLKKGHAISIERMAGKSIGVGSQHSLPSWFSASSLGFLLLFLFIDLFLYFIFV